MFFIGDAPEEKEQSCFWRRRKQDCKQNRLTRFALGYMKGSSINLPEQAAVELGNHPGISPLFGAPTLIIYRVFIDEMEQNFIASRHQIK